MAMEQTRVQSPAAQPPARAGAPARPAADGTGADVSAQGGFALLLATLDAGADTADTLPGEGGLLAADEAGTPAQAAAEAPDATALAWLLAGQSPAAPLPPIGAAGGDTGTLRAGTPAGGLAEGASLSLALAGADAHWTPTTMVAETARLDGAPDLAEGLERGGLGARATRVRALPGAATAAATAAAGPGRGLAADGAAASPAGTPAPGAAAALEAAGAVPAGARPGAAGDAATGRGAGGGPAERAEAAPGGLAPAMADGAAVRAPAGAPAQAAERFAAPQAGLEPGGPDLQGREPAVDAAALAPDAAAQAGADAAETLLADRVAYWVHQQTQNAALTLEREGQQVHVRVSLTGNQAHVTFHSDEAQARQVLDAGTAELRALLDAQGLQLAGVTIGSSPQGQGNAGRGGGAQGEPPAGARRTLVRAGGGAEGPAGPVGARRAHVTERSVDIFV